MRTISSVPTAGSATCRTAVRSTISRKARPQLTSNPLDIAIDGDAFLAVQTAAGERYTRDGNLQLNSQGQLVTASGDPLLGTSGPIVFQPTDHDINISPDGTVSVLEGASRHRLGPRQASPGQFRRCAEAPEARQQPVFGRGRRDRAARYESRRCAQGYIEKSNVNSVVEMSRMVEIMRTYTQVASLLQQQSDLHKNAIEKLADVPA